MKVTVINEGLMKKQSGYEIDTDGNPQMSCTIGDSKLYLDYDGSKEQPYILVIEVGGYELTANFDDYDSALDYGNKVAKGIKPEDTSKDIKRKFKDLTMTRMY